MPSVSTPSAATAAAALAVSVDDNPCTQDSSTPATATIDRCSSSCRFRELPTEDEDTQQHIDSTASGVPSWCKYEGFITTERTRCLQGLLALWILTMILLLLSFASSSLSVILLLVSLILCFGIPLAAYSYFCYCPKPTRRTSSSSKEQELLEAAVRKRPKIRSADP